ncbi:MAG TPA: protein kinase, partial [Byssovorax sp.]
ELVFLVMELLEGETLRDRWLRAQKRMPVAESLGVVEQVLDVLAAAHAQGVVHRDVKPENVWLGRDGRVRLIDFGIARLRDEDADDGGKLTRVGDSSIGTPGFMPPEQARGRWDDIDGRADIYGVAAMFFTLVTGEYVHPGEGATELFIAAATEQARSILEVMPTLSPAIAAVVDRALQFEAERRFATADEMRAALSASWRAGISRATMPDSSAPPAPMPTCRPVASSTPPPPSQRRAARVFSAAFAVVGLIALAWTGFAIRGARGTSAPRSSAAVHERASAAPRPVYAPPLPSTPNVTATASAAASAAPPPRRRRLRGGQGLVEIDDAPAPR